MQPNTITLSVDKLNDAVAPVSEDYERFEEFLNRSVYVGANHSPAARDTITLYRTFPTKNGNFNGVQKSAIKLSEDVSVVGVDSATTLTAPMIMEISFSFPVGVSAADQLAFRQRGLSTIDLDSVVTPLNNQLMV